MHNKNIIDTIAQPSNFLIVAGVLKGYIKHPFIFLVKSKSSFRKFKRSIKLDLPNDFIDTAGFLAWMYIRLSKKIDKKKAFEIIRTVVVTYGLAIQQANFRNVEEPRTFANLVKYQQINNQQGSTKLNTMEIIEQSEQKYEFRITRCLFYEFFSSLGVPELTSVMCSIDNAIFNSYLPEKITFHRNGIGRSFVEGHKYCEFVIENNEK
jgi:predicted hydrocarbon binding protein